MTGVVYGDLLETARLTQTRVTYLSEIGAIVVAL